jgi:hypothetical protein
LRRVKPFEFARRADAIIDAANDDPTSSHPADDVTVGGPDDQGADRDTRELPLLRGEHLAGRGLTRFVVSTGLLTASVAAAAAALAWLGIWEPLVAVVVLLVLAALSWRLSGVVPTRALPVWAAMALLVISLGATTWAGLTHDEQVLPRAEAGVNAQAAISLAKGHQWPIPLSANDLGAPGALQIAGVTVGSPGFRQVGQATEPRIEPQALIAVPAWLSIGFWVGGAEGMLWVIAIFGGLAVLGIGLLTSSVVGPRWGPLGALSAAICFPVLHAARATTADIVVVFVLSSGLLLLVAATRAGVRGRWQQARAVGLLAGVLVASASFFRLDALGQTALLLPVAALLVVRRDRAGSRLLWGAGAATAFAALTAVGLSGGLVREQRSSLIPLVLLASGVALLSAVMVLLARRGARVPDRVRAVLPTSAATSAAIGGVALLALPSRQALVWTSWWTGAWALAITLLVVSAAAHHLARAWVRGERVPGWIGAISVGLAATVLHWLPPSQDQRTPWVDAGLVVAVPLVILCAVMAAALVTRWTTRHLPTVAAVVASVGAVAALLVPEAVATLPHADQRLSRGQLAAVQQVCRSFGSADVALMIDDRAADEWLPAVRANCDVPAMSLTPATRHDPGARAQAVAAVANSVSARGGRLVVMAASSVAAIEDSAAAIGPATRIGAPVAVLNASLTQEPGRVDGRPDGLSSFPVQVWLAAVR